MKEEEIFSVLLWNIKSIDIFCLDNHKILPAESLVQKITVLENLFVKKVKGTSLFQKY